MNSSQTSSSTLQLKNVFFENGTQLGVENTFSTEVRVKKRLRVDGDLSVNGKINYVDNQTGWGLDEWTLTDSSKGYSKNKDSLIIKVYNIETNYATKQYVDNTTHVYSSAGLNYYPANTFPKMTSGNYPYPITTLIANSSFIFRDSSTTQMNLQFQKGTIAIGKVLTCIDEEGTVGWREVTSGSSTTIENIQTNIGRTNTEYSFYAVDTFTGVSKGFYYIPSIDSNLHNLALQTNDITQLMGVGGKTNSTFRHVIACYSYGSESITFQNSTSASSPNGYTRIMGGTNNTLQYIQLDNTGIKITPVQNTSVQFPLPKMDKNIHTDTYSHPVHIYGEWGISEFPMMMIEKQDSTTNHRAKAIMFNPLTGKQNWNPIVDNGDITIISGDLSGGNVLTSLHYTDNPYRLVIAPWSRYCDGIVIRPSFLPEESVSNPTTSGFTRISAASGYFEETTIPGHYIEVNRGGIVLKNFITTKSINYGPFCVRNFIGEHVHLNDSSNYTIQGSLEVGESSSHCDSIFNGHVHFMSGGVTMSDSVNILGDIHFPTNSANGKVLYSKDSNGTFEWKYLPTEYNQLTIIDISTNGVSFEGITNLFQDDGDFRFENTITNGLFSFVLQGVSNVIESLKITSNGVYFNVPISMPVGAQTGKIISALDNNGKFGWVTPAVVNVPTTYETLEIDSLVTQEIEFPTAQIIEEDNIFHLRNYHAGGRFNFSCPRTSIDDIITPFVITGNGLYMAAPLFCYNGIDITGDVTLNQGVNIPNESHTEISSSIMPTITWHTSEYLYTFFDYQSLPLIPGGKYMIAGGSYPRTFYSQEFKEVFSFTVPSYHYYQPIDILVPIYIHHSWQYGHAKQENNEVVYLWYEIEQPEFQVYRNNIFIESFKVDYKYGIQIFNKRVYIASNPSVYDVCLQPQTDWFHEVYIGQIPLTYKLPTESDPGDVFTFRLQVKGTFATLGEDIYMMSQIIIRWYPQDPTSLWDTVVVPNAYNLETINVEVVANINHPDPDVNKRQYRSLLYNTKIQVISDVNVEANRQWQWDPTLVKRSEYCDNSMFMPKSDRIRLCGTLNATRITTQEGIFSLGKIYSDGVAGRRGTGTTVPGVRTNFRSGSSYGSYYAWGNAFNWYWTSGGVVEIWVDDTMVHNFAPNYCDYRLKENIQNVSKVIDRLMKIPIFIYDRIANGVMGSSQRHVGLFAHELQNLFPEIDHLVIGTQDEYVNDKPLYQSVTNEITFLLMKGIQELKEENNLLKEQLLILRNEINAIALQLSHR